MKKVIFLILILSVTLRSFGQFSFKNDKHFKFHADSMLVAVGIGHPDFEKVDFELRYWITDLLGDFARELFIMQRLKDNSWNLIHYQLCYSPNEHHYTIISKKDSSLAGWGLQWGKLVSFNLPNLPDEKQGSKKWRTPDNGIIVIADGSYYIFELIKKKRKRSFGYSNPEDNLTNYGAGFEELVNINKAITLFNQQLG